MIVKKRLIRKSTQNLISFPVLFGGVSRSIVVSVVGTTNKLQYRSNIVLESFNGFIEYIEPFFSEVKDYYVLTTKSSLEKAVIDILLFALFFPLVTSSRVFDCVYSNNLILNIPVGLAKLLDVVSKPVKRLHEEGDSNDTFGIVNSKLTLEYIIELLEFMVQPALTKAEIEKLGLSDEEVEDRRCASDYFEKFRDFLAREGFACNTRQLRSVIRGVIEVLTKYEEAETLLEKVNIMFDNITSLRTSVIRLPFVEFVPNYPFSKNLNIFKFRSTSVSGEYRILSKAISSLDESSKQISVIYLGLLKPKLYVNESIDNSVLPDDSLVNTNIYTRRVLLSAFFSFGIESVGLGNSLAPSTVQPADTNNAQTPQKKNFSTLAKQVVSGDFMTTSSYKVIVRRPLIIEPLRFYPAIL